MSEVTTIQIKKEILEKLKENKKYERQSYSELIGEMTEIYKSIKMKNQYDEFLHKIQQEKMKELWNNKSDEDWENA